MGATSRRKGASGEREFARVLGQLIGEPDCLQRNLEQPRSGGDDLKIRANAQPDKNAVLARLDRFSLEVKRYANAKPSSIVHWWQQAVVQSRDYNPVRLPLLAYRLDRGSWQCSVHLSSEIPLESFCGCLTMDIKLFAEFLRKGMPHEQH